VKVLTVSLLKKARVSGAGWPQRVVAIASGGGAASCRLTGHALSGLTCNKRHTLCLAVHDAYDNPRRVH
jgi:hypothetical protein